MAGIFSEACDWLNLQKFLFWNYEQNIKKIINDICN